MYKLNFLKGKLPFLITLICCLTVASLAAGVRATGSSPVRETSAQTQPKQVVILDAGHPALW